MANLEGVPDPIEQSDDNENLGDYTPSVEQIKRLDSFLEIVEASDAEEVQVVVAGGYGLDGLYGKLTRDHDDIDLVVPDEKLDNMRNILEQVGYEHDATEGAKEIFVNHDLGDFKVEYGAMSSLDKFSERGREDFITESNNASLNGRGFRAITIDGVKKIVEVQNKRAVEGSWKAFPASKRLNQKKIIAELEKE